MSVREQTRLESTRAIAGAALRLVERHGFAAVTVDDIAAEADVSRRTFFNHFPTKAAALFDPDPADATRLADLLEAADGVERLWPALREICASFVGGHEEVIAVRRRLTAEYPELDQYHRTAHRHVEIALREWAVRQPATDSYGATLAANSAATIMITAFSTWQPDQEPVHLIDLVRRGFDLVASAFDS